MKYWLVLTRVIVCRCVVACLNYEQYSKSFLNSPVGSSDGHWPSVWVNVFGKEKEPDTTSQRSCLCCEEMCVCVCVWSYCATMTRTTLTKILILVILAFIVCLPEFFSLHRGGSSWTVTHGLCGPVCFSHKCQCFLLSSQPSFRYLLFIKVKQKNSFLHLFFKDNP